MKTTKLKRGWLLGVIAAGLCVHFPVAKSQPSSDPPWTLDHAIVRALEARIVMPKGAKPVGTYTRYYQPGYDHGRRVVFGVLTQEGDKQVHISGSPLLGFDNGCSVINLTFDVDERRVTSIACDGVA